MIRIEHSDYLEIAQRHFGPNPAQWRMKCPSCGHEQCIAEALDRSADIGDPWKWIFTACEGRHNSDVGCDWTLGGLFKIHTLEVRHEGALTPVFEFASEAAMADARLAAGKFVEFEHPTTEIVTWEAFDWADMGLAWVPSEVREQIERFWGCFGRTPKMWMEDSVQQHSPGIGAEVTMPTWSKGESATGRFVHCWNNIGRVIDGNGNTHAVSF